jgi:hypothetical protein
MVAAYSFDGIPEAVVMSARKDGTEQNIPPTRTKVWKDWVLGTFGDSFRIAPESPNEPESAKEQESPKEPELPKEPEETPSPQDDRLDMLKAWGLPRSFVEAKVDTLCLEWFGR